MERKNKQEKEYYQKSHTTKKQIDRTLKHDSGHKMNKKSRKGWQLGIIVLTLQRI